MSSFAQNPFVSRSFAVARRHAALILCLALAGVSVYVGTGTVGDYVDGSITRPFYFSLRERLGRDPELDPKLKILSYDDTSVDRLQRADLTIDDWASVLSAIAAEKPRVILIDKIFSIVFDPNDKQAEALARFDSIDVPIVVGAFAVERESKLRQPLDLSRDFYQASGELPINDNRFNGWHVYGPSPLLTPYLAAAGHLLYFDNGLVSALLSPRTGTFVPHMSLFAASKREVRNSQFFADETLVPVNDRGQLIVNFSNPDKYYTRHKRLGTAVIAARSGQRVTGIEPGDTVVILPEMFTGSTDFKVTPLGIMPGGFIITAMVNSVLRREWIHLLPGLTLQILLLSLVGTLWGRSVTSARYWIGQILGTVAFGGLCVFLFVAHRTLVPGLLPLVSAWACSLVMFGERTWVREREARRVRAELSDAAEMAKAFRPDPLPTWSRLEISAYHRPISEASGDWFAFREAPSKKLQHFVLADITGHGVQAALMVSIAKTMLKVATKDEAVLEDRDFLLHYSRALNSMLYEHGKGQHLLTLLAITFDIGSASVHYLSAGHPPPIIFSPHNHGERRFSQLATRSTVLGLSEMVNLRMHDHPLASGDELVAYTDGLPVGRHIRAVNSFFVDRNFSLPASPEALLASVWASETRRTGRTLDDDVSIVWFKAA